MPNRIIKESIRTSYEINELSPEAEVSFYRLLTFADDFGRFPSDIRILQAQLFPLKASIRSKDFNTWLSELIQADLIHLYIADDNKPYGYFPTWEDHQTIRNQKSKHPEPEGERYDDLDAQLKETDRIRKQLKSIEYKSYRESNPIQSESNPNLNPSTDVEINFDEFWEAYDKKVDKKKSKHKWNKLKKSEKESIMEFITKYKGYQPDPQYRKNPTTFFNNRTWEDEFIINQVKQGKTAEKRKGIIFTYKQMLDMIDSGKYSESNFQIRDDKKDAEGYPMRELCTS